MAPVLTINGKRVLIPEGIDPSSARATRSTSPGETMETAVADAPKVSSRNERTSNHGNASRGLVLAMWDD